MQRCPSVLEGDEYEEIRVRLLAKENSKGYVREILNFKLELSTKVVGHAE